MDADFVPNVLGVGVRECVQFVEAAPQPFRVKRVVRTGERFTRLLGLIADTLCERAQFSGRGRLRRERGGFGAGERLVEFGGADAQQAGEF